MKIKGSVTVFVSIVLSVLIAFSGMMVDLSRLRAGEKHARAAVQLSVQSALTQYHAPLKENYGLMATGHTQDKLEALISELLENNLAVENRYMPGLTDLYGFQVENITVTPMFNLTEDDVLQQQITQFMKYRAPVSAVGNFLEKLKSLKTCMAQSGLLNNKMDLEKKLQKIREEQVYLKLLLSERIHGFTSGKKPGAEIQRSLTASDQYLEIIRSLEAPDGVLDIAWKKIPEYTEIISEAQRKISGLEGEISSLRSERGPYETRYSSLQSQIDSIDTDIKNINKEIENLEKDIAREQGKKKPDNSAISAMQARIDALRQSLQARETEKSSLISERDMVSGRISEIEGKISSKQSDIHALEASIQDERAELQLKVNTCVASLEEIRSKAGFIRDQIAVLQAVAEKYTHYHQEAQILIDEAKRGCEQAQALTEQIRAEIAEQSRQSDSAFLTRIKADIQKLVLNADPAVLEAIRTDIDSNLVILQSITTAISTASETTRKTLNDLDQFIEKAKKIPQTCQPFPREEFASGTVEALRILSEQITGKIVNYRKPEYTIEPAINQKERNEFARWCNRIFGEDNETDTSRDKGQQKKLKQNIKDKDEENRENQKTFKGSDEKMSDKDLEKLFKSLPSWRDEKGNYPNVVSSGNFTGHSENSPLPDSEENRNTDIEQSYSNALDRNGSFAKIIGEALVDAGEALIQSLYVNEYIVSAFKNANMDTDTRTLLLHNRQPQDTFYEKAEVEYILYGCRREKTNANLAQVTIFGIRMGLNLIHVYTNSDKTATALTAATAIAGWTGFGVPIVKNLILIGWAAGESWMDVKDINAGKDVAVYKTKNTWRLDLKSLFSNIADEIMKDSSQWLKQTTGDLVTNADKVLQDTVSDIVSSLVHETFLPLEETITEFGEAGETVAEPEDPGLQEPGNLNSLEDLEAWISDMAQKQFDAVKKQSVEWTKVKLEECKKKITEKILEYLFKSEAYKNFVSQVRGGLNDLIDSGTNQINEAIQKLGNKIGDTGTKDQLVGTVVSFDYTDYLRLLLFVVPQKIKLLRCADLMQLNMRKTLDNPDFLLSNYHSFVIVEADISMRFFFLPNLNKDRGQIRVRWGYGY